MASIYNLSWGKTSFLAKLQLFFKSRKQEKEKIQSFNRQVQAEGCSALSSTYYSIAGTAFSHLNGICGDVFGWRAWSVPFRLTIWLCAWLPLALWCYWRMLSLSNRVVKLIGYDGMSADECDVRQSILRRRGRYGEAKKCIYAALAKNPEKAHTRGLLHAALAELLRNNGEYEKGELLKAFKEAENAEKEDPRQAARVYRACAKLVEHDDLFGAAYLCYKAKKLAEATGASDQLLKM